MDITQLSPDFSICGQIGSKDIQLVNSMGFRTILCNRPDGEDGFQPSFEMIADAAKLQHIAAHYLPITPKGPTDQDIAAFERLFPDMPKPVLAYCRSGGRSAALFRRSSLGQAG